MLNNYIVAKVALSDTSFSYDLEYSYAVPESLVSKVVEGIRVLVPFGRANRKRIGFVTRTYQRDSYNPELKPLISVVDSEPLVNAEMLKMIFWLKENTFCTFFDAYRTVVPTGFGLKYSNNYKLTTSVIDESLLDDEERSLLAFLQNAVSQKEFDALLDVSETPSKRKVVDRLVEKDILIESDKIKRRVGDETVRMVKLSPEYEAGEIVKQLTPKQHAVVETLEQNGSASIKEICYINNVTSAVVKNLIKLGILTEYEYEVMRMVTDGSEADCSPDDIVLSQQQSTAYNGICEMLDEGKPAGALLYGVTGSGKTSVFIKLIDRVLKSGRQAMMLVPEIALTPQMVAKFQSNFGTTVAVVHSSLSLGQRVDEFKRIKNGQARIVIGTRSAVFAPLDNIGLIIIDEEGERSYKSESPPRYHARDCAIQRAGSHKAVVLMASATPSIESYYYAKNKRFRLFELSERYSKNRLPEVVIVDMQLEASRGNASMFSEGLAESIKQTLENKEQTILLLNRRGYHTYLSCADCREPLACPNCAIPLTYHKKNNALMCHFCGYSSEMTTSCSKCGSTHLFTSGVGTQRIEDELSALFPEARVLRMDADTTYSRYAYEKNFADFGEGKYDIMIGTQMIAKGLDFPNVTLVGVLSLDKALFLGDFRSYERTFSLITQVVGRGGRADKTATAFLQTFVPEHYVLNLAAKQDYKEFYNEEIALRKALLYPPFCDICVVNFSSPVEIEAEKASKAFVKMMKDKISAENLSFPLRVLGPAKCEMVKINNRYRWRIIMKCRNNKDFRAFLTDVMKTAYKSKAFASVTFFADINGDIGL